VKTDNRQPVTPLVKIGRVAGLFTAGLLAAVACKSFVLEENVFTGSSSRAGSTSSGGGSTSPGRGGSGGTSNGTSGADSSTGGELASNGGSVSRGGGSNSTGGLASVGGNGGGGVEVEPEIPDEPFTKAGLLRQAADCAVARYKDFEVHALALDAAAKANVAEPSASTASALNNAWLVANSSWQIAEVFRFGPAGRSADLDKARKNCAIRSMVGAQVGVVRSRARWSIRRTRSRLSRLH